MTGARNHTNHRVGEWHGRAKYSDAVVKAIRAEYQRGVVGKGMRALAKRHGMPLATARDILTYATRASA